MASRENILAAALVAILVVQAVYFAANSTYTYDETVSVINGNYYLTTGDLRLGLSQPPLSAYISALPLFFLNVNFDFSSEACRSYDNWMCAQQVLFEQGNDAGRILFFSRLMSIAATAAAAVVVFLLARRLFGPRPALLALGLFAFNQVIISHGSLALTNAFLNLFVVLNLLLFHSLLRRYSLKLLILFSLSFAAAAATKANAVLLLPASYLFILLAFWRLKSPSAPLLLKPFRSMLKIFLFHLAVLAVVSFIALWAIYLFQFTTFADSVPPKYVDTFSDRILPKIPSSLHNAAEFVVFKLSVPFPSFFSGTAWHTVAGETKLSFFLGEPFTGVKLLFFPVVFLAKSAIGFLLLLAIGVAISTKGRPRESLLYLAIPAAVWFAFFALTLNSGVQHILPVYSLLAIIAGRAALWLTGINLKSAVVVAAAACTVLSSIAVAPHYLAYYNELSGGPDKGHYIAGAPNFDWGQDLVNLKEYIGSQNVKLSYFGTASPYYYGINFTYIASPRFQPWDPDYTAHVPEGYTEQCGRTTGLIAVSATNYYGIFLNDKACYSWLSSYEPIAKVGHTIFVYNISS